jgi:hypothetical protein
MIDPTRGQDMGNTLGSGHGANFMACSRVENRDFIDRCKAAEKIWQSCRVGLSKMFSSIFNQQTV